MIIEKVVLVKWVLDQSSWVIWYGHYSYQNYLWVNKEDFPRRHEYGKERNQSVQNKVRFDLTHWTLIYSQCNMWRRVLMGLTGWRDIRGMITCILLFQSPLPHTSHMKNHSITLFLSPSLYFAWTNQDVIWKKRINKNSLSFYHIFDFLIYRYYYFWYLKKWVQSIACALKI